jgi:hypothetical protein
MFKYIPPGCTCFPAEEYPVSNRFKVVDYEEFVSNI